MARPEPTRLPGRDRRGWYRSWRNSHQINDREQPDPDDVERVPEQGEAPQPALHVAAEAFDGDLRHHYRQPDQAGGDVQAVAADQGKEGGQERAALRGCAL